MPIQFVINLSNCYQDRIHLDSDTEIHMLQMDDVEASANNPATPTSNKVLLKKVLAHGMFFSAGRGLVAAVVMGNHLFFAPRGETSAAAISIASSTQFFLIGPFHDCLTATNIAVAHNHHTDSHHNIGPIATDGLIASAILTVPASVAAALLGPILRTILQNEDDAVIDKVQQYFYPFIGGIFFALAFKSDVGLILGINRVKTTLASNAIYALLQGAIGYPLANKIGLPGLSTGIVGASVITFTAQRLLMRRAAFAAYHITYQKIPLQTLWPRGKKHVAKGAVIGLQTLNACGGFLFPLLAHSIGGVQASAAQSPAMAIIITATIFQDACAQACTSDVRAYIGAGQINNVKKTSLYYLGMYGSMTVCASATLAMSRRQIANAFSDHDTDHATIALMQELLIVASIALPITFVRTMLVGLHRAYEDNTFPFVCNLLITNIAGFIAGYTIADRKNDIKWLYIAHSLTELLTVVIMTHRLKGNFNYLKQHKVLKEIKCCNALPSPTNLMKSAARCITFFKEAKPPLANRENSYGSRINEDTNVPDRNTTYAFPCAIL